MSRLSFLCDVVWCVVFCVCFPKRTCSVICIDASGNQGNMYDTSEAHKKKKKKKKKKTRHTYTFQKQKHTNTQANRQAVNTPALQYHTTIHKTHTHTLNKHTPKQAQTPTQQQTMTHPTMNHTNDPRTH